MAAMTKQQRIDNETLRRAQEGDFSDYVKEKVSGAASRLGKTVPLESDFTSKEFLTSPQNGMQDQSTAVNLINQLSATPTWPEIRARKEQLVGIPAVTTDIDEERNMYQYMINEMLRAGQKPTGAQLLDVSQIPEGWRRTGGTTFTDPNNPNLLRDLKGLAMFENPGVVNLKDYDNEGILNLEPFQKDWAQDQLGITNWGDVIKGLISGATPLKYVNMLTEKVQDFEPVNQLQQAATSGLELLGGTIKKGTQAYDDMLKWMLSGWKK